MEILEDGDRDTRMIAQNEALKLLEIDQPVIAQVVKYDIS
jgi:hypothetical protein